MHVPLEQETIWQVAGGSQVLVSLPQQAKQLPAPQQTPPAPLPESHVTPTSALVRHCPLLHATASHTPAAGQVLVSLPQHSWHEPLQQILPPPQLVPSSGTEPHTPLLHTGSKQTGSGSVQVLASLPQHSLHVPLQQVPVPPAFNSHVPPVRSSY